MTLRHFMNDFFQSPGEAAPIRFPERPLLAEALRQRTGLKVLVFVLALLTAGLNLAVPWAQRTFVNDLEHGRQAYVWVVAAFAAALAAQALSFIYRVLATRDGLLLQKSLSEALYLKALRLAHSERAGRTVGDLITYYAQDVSTASQVVEEFLPGFLGGILPIIIAPLALGAMLDLPLTAVLVVLLTSLGITVWLGMRQAYFFALNKRNAQHRLALVNEWLQNIRVLRALGWVESFEREITRRRTQESRDRLRMVTNGSTMNSLTQTLPFLLNLTTVWAMVSAYGRSLSPGDVFAVLWIFGVFLARPLRTFPFLLVTWNDCATSTKRLAAFLALPDEERTLGLQPSVGPEPASNPASGALTVEGLSLTLDGHRILDDISFSCKAGEFVAIVGEVGSGKTLLLQSLVRHVPAHFSRYEIDGRDMLKLPLSELRAFYSLAPQDSFVMSSTLRDNVALDYGSPERIDAHVREMLSIAEFQLEKEQVPDGLATQIGERGVNLSGGQRQRVNLARCAHFERPLLLLDDSLSAVDVDTERRLQEKLFCGHWKNRTRLLVTHRLSILPSADRILVLEGGRIVEQGPPAELLRHSPRLARLAAKGEA